MENYQVFATVYDDLMDKSLYPLWRDYVTKRVPAQSKILELASGTADLAKLLLQQGFDVTVSDLSAEMLDLAVANLEEIPQDVEIYQFDMREFDFAGQYDAAICFDDSICYLSDEQEVLTTFKNVAASLKNHGKFLFDCHSLYQMDEVFPEYMFNEINDDYTFVWKSFEGEQPHSIEHVLQIFVPETETATSKYQLFEEIHRERTYEIATYQKLLAQAGFEVKSVTSDFTDTLDQAHGRRIFFECEKVN